jgi:hypothetical protein
MAASSQLAAVWRVLEVIYGVIGEVHLQQQRIRCHNDQISAEARQSGMHGC